MPVRKVSSVRAPTTQLSEAENLELLNEQRSLRPSSPHFTIYQPQLTWLASIANRVTGAGLSVGECPGNPCPKKAVNSCPFANSSHHPRTSRNFSPALYGYALAYLAAPYAGLGEAISSAGLTDLVAMAPVWLKIGLKAPLAAAASFHTFNGLRHLAWDWGYCEYALSLAVAYEDDSNWDTRGRGGCMLLEIGVAHLFLWQTAVGSGRGGDDQRMWAKHATMRPFQRSHMQGSHVIDGAFQLGRQAR